MNHTVTESSFDSPCTRQTNARGLDTGLDTGLDSAFNSATQSADGYSQPTFAFSVEDDTTPQWFYCRQTNDVNHCHDGMVFGLNPPQDGNTFGKFQKKAQALGREKDHGKKYDDGKWDQNKHGYKQDESKVRRRQVQVEQVRRRPPRLNESARATTTSQVLSTASLSRPAHISLVHLPRSLLCIAPSSPPLLLFFHLYPSSLACSFTLAFPRTDACNAPCTRLLWLGASRETPRAL